ncbi:hypothetical protein GCM10011325_03030 [Dyadobacter sediminis]|nr:hypothetical protein GCM10011325_03030 [Dyadobacter sediminis]
MSFLFAAETEVAFYTGVNDFWQNPFVVKRRAHVLLLTSDMVTRLAVSEHELLSYFDLTFGRIALSAKY